jgi:hypothetical protein
MNMPGFTAEASLCKTNGRYRSIEGQSRGSGWPGIIPQFSLDSGWGDRCPPGYFWHCDDPFVVTGKPPRCRCVPDHFVFERILYPDWLVDFST